MQQQPVLPPLILLHGFLGSSRDWKLLQQELPEDIRIITPDLPGFGTNKAPAGEKHYSLRGYMDCVLEVINSLSEKPVICGYSMGGRVALGLCKQYPELLKGVVIISSGAGIENEEERRKRRETDERLIRLAETMQPENFLTFWYNQELFSTLPLFTDMKQFIAGRKENYYLPGIAASLRFFGQGVMPYLGSSEEKIKLPALLIAGEKDIKYTASMQELKNVFATAEYKEVQGVSHALHLEKPEELATFVVSFLKNL